MTVAEDIKGRNTLKNGSVNENPSEKKGVSRFSKMPTLAAGIMTACALSFGSVGCSGKTTSGQAPEVPCEAPVCAEATNTQTVLVGDTVDVGGVKVKASGVKEVDDGNGNMVKTATIDVLDCKDSPVATQDIAEGQTVSVLVPDTNIKIDVTASNMVLGDTQSVDLAGTMTCIDTADGGTTDGGTQPGDPGQQPGDPGQQPGDPGTQPGDPGQQPGDGTVATCSGVSYDTGAFSGILYVGTSQRVGEFDFWYTGKDSSGAAVMDVKKCDGTVIAAGKACPEDLVTTIDVAEDGKKIDILPHTNMDALSRMRIDVYKPYTPSP